MILSYWNKEALNVKTSKELLEEGLTVHGEKPFKRPVNDNCEANVAKFTPEDTRIDTIVTGHEALADRQESGDKWFGVEQSVVQPDITYRDTSEKFNYVVNQNGFRPEESPSIPDSWVEENSSSDSETDNPDTNNTNETVDSNTEGG